ncbi:MAG: sulfate adenylyltransferase [Planctomycetota bacterium]|nr:sulfate adenylyltransferase [Planctomycetota bacterium]MDG2144059.1 sulfate adenylyltransferase [Planctomycetota bacterium]
MSSTTLAFPSPVHGGLDSLVNRIVPASDAWAGLTKVAVNDTDMTTLYRIADGTLSPLTGPMGSADMGTVLADCAIERDGKSWAWGIPTILPVTDAEAAAMSAGDEIALEGANGIFGVLKVTEVYDWDKAAFLKGCYGTERTDHPGAGLWMGDERTKCVAGEISLQEFSDTRDFKGYVNSAAETRELIQNEGWEQAIAFQTRNPLHRAHEYALVYGAETILRENGKKTGVVLNPLVGQLKGDDVPAATRMETYISLLDNNYLGEGDMDIELWSSKGQNLNDQAKLVGLDMRMYYGGPREAVMHAIYRQNHGFSHFIIGRKHADAPFADGDAIWGDFDAQTIFDDMKGALAIKTVNVGFAAFFKGLGRVGLMSEHKDDESVFISGTKVRSILGDGELPDDRIMRPSTAEILVAYYKSQA